MQTRNIGHDRNPRQQVSSRCGHTSREKGHFSIECCYSTTQPTELQATARELSMDTVFLNVMSTNQETTMWNITEHYTD